MATQHSPHWPELPIDAWADTCATLHLYTQVVGKVRLALAPRVNHGWQVTLYPTTCGLTTSPMPWRAGFVQIDFDFLAHELRITTDAGAQRRIALVPRSVAGFYRACMEALRALDIDVVIRPRAVEIPQNLRLDEDTTHASYDPDYAQRCWRILLRTQAVMQRYRGDFLGKCSPAHFFWGSFDLAQTRFSGRPAPPHPGGIPNLADRVTREAYSHECSSCGFWPGAAGAGDALFYAYAYPEPPGYQDAPMPEGAFYSPELHEFVLPYETLRRHAQADDLLLTFFQATYAAAAKLGDWDRAALERGST